MTDAKEVGGGRTGEEGFKGAQEYRAFDVEATEAVEHPTKIEKSDIKPGRIEAGGTEIVLQRHYKYIRDREDPNAGGIAPEVAKEGKNGAIDFFRSALEQVPEGERDSVHVLVVASDTEYFKKGRRSYETGSIVQEAAEEVFKENEVPTDNVINTTGRLKSLDGKGGPKPMPRLREPNFLQDSPDYAQFLLDKHDGEINLGFWIDFEEDTYKAEREGMGAEGPAEIADRTAFTVEALAKYAEMWHRANPDQRLIIWAATHYDTISPYVKREVFEVPNADQLLVDYGGGITIDIDVEGKATSEIGGKEYAVPVKSSEKEPTES